MSPQRRQQIAEFENRWIHRVSTGLLGVLVFFAARIYNDFEDTKTKVVIHEQRINDMDRRLAMAAQEIKELQLRVYNYKP